MRPGNEARCVRHARDVCRSEKSFISELSIHTIEGYSIEGDFHLMARSWTFAADIVACPERVVDLQTFAKMVRRSLHMNLALIYACLAAIFSLSVRYNSFHR